MAGCVSRSLLPVFHRLPKRFHAYIPVHFVLLLHGARTTAQTTVAKIHTASLPPITYSTKTMLLSCGHTLPKRKLVLRLSK